MKTPETVRCRLCGSDRYEPAGADVSGAPDARVYRCLDCTLVFLFPIMTVEEEAAFYRVEFSRYMEGRAGSTWQSPEAHFRAQQPEGERRLPLVRPHLLSTDAVLEVGCSTGYFLDDLRGYVQSVTGVEPSQAHREYATTRGLEVVASPDELPPGSFDVIALYYVLEHLRDPIGYLASLGRLLRPGGRLLIEVPNVEDALLARYDIPPFAPFYWQKAHYHYFSRGTLETVLKQAGYGAMLWPVQRYDLSNHVVWMSKGRSGGAGRYADLFTRELESAYAEALKRAWACDTLFAVATVSDRGGPGMTRRCSGEVRPLCGEDSAVLDESIREEQSAWNSDGAREFYRKNRAQPSALYRSERFFLPGILAQVESALDVGCATGGFCKIMRSFNPRLRYVGVDVIPDLIEAAKQDNPDAEFYVADGVTLPFAPSSFDLVHSTGVLHVNSRQMEILSAMWALTRRYALFDLRLTKGPGVTGQIRVAFDGPVPDSRPLPYIVTNMDETLQEIMKLDPRPATIRVRGYPHPISPMATLPLTQCVMAFFLLEKAPADRVAVDIQIEE